MAVISLKEKSTLKLELDAGIVDGRQKVQSKSFNKVKTDAEDQALFETAVALSGLQDKEVLKVKKVEEVVLVEE